MSRFINQTAIITGASRGLGLQIAQRLCKEGANVVLIARSLEKLLDVRDLLMKEVVGDQTVEVFPVDLAVSSAVENLCVQLNTLFPKIDILVNNAAIHGPIGPIWENDWQEWQRTQQINLLAPIMLCRNLLPNMIRHQYGKIICLSGGGAATSRPNFSAYAVAKAGLVRFSEILADEVKNYNITVNCIAPGMMNTALLAEVLAAGPEKAGKKEFNSVEQKISQPKNDTQAAVDLCVYLAAAESHKITGKLISAVWDPWQNLAEYNDDLVNSDIYTLRRIVPKDRGKNWGEAT